MPTTRQIGRIPSSVAKDLKRGTNYLLGVGINAYAHFPKLNNAVKDVEDVTDALLKNYYFERENVRLLLVKMAIIQPKP